MLIWMVFDLWVWVCCLSLYLNAGLLTALPKDLHIPFALRGRSGQAASDCPLHSSALLRHLLHAKYLFLYQISTYHRIWPPQARPASLLPRNTTSKSPHQLRLTSIPICTPTHPPAG